jgi:NAD(P)-dependent dehydrogenase (short-subunit alcohol dehydrogenase family)
LLISSIGGRQIIFYLQYVSCTGRIKILSAKIFQMNANKKVAIVTGGTHGIGAATAIKLAAQGISIALVARSSQHMTVKKKIDSMNVPCLMITADLEEEAACEQAVKEIYTHFGRIDILVHSAGSAAPGGLLNGARDHWHKAFNIHVHAAFYLCSAAVPYIKEHGDGAIVLISSAAGLRGVKNSLAYAAAKGAIPQFVRALAFELADDNITVNCVSPGVIRTRFQDYLTPQQVKNNIDNRIPLHREGTPEDVANVIQMLVTNNFITGENVVIDGGMTMRIA